MRRTRFRRATGLVLYAILASALGAAAAMWAEAQESAPARIAQPANAAPPVPFQKPAPLPEQSPLPINLPTALQLANAQALDIRLASERIRVAAAQLDRARTLWLPTIYVGTDYFRHDGQIQDVAGSVFGTSKQAFLIGAGPSAVFAVSDALFEPLAQRQVLRAREASLQTATNDTFLAVAEAYFTVQQARGELAGALDTARRAEELVQRVEKLGDRYIAGVEVIRARTELSRRRQAASLARDKWRVAASELQRILRLDPLAIVEPVEPPHLAMSLVSLEEKVDGLIPVALSNRPELATQQALVQANWERWRQERLRPLVPSVLLRGAATNPAGTLAGGAFGGGLNDNLRDFSARGDFDIQVIWELQNLGFGNRARREERRAEHESSILELFRVQDQVAAEVVQAHALVHSAAGRIKDAESGLRDAADSLAKNLEGLRQTKQGDLIVLLIRPQEVVDAVRTLSLAYNDYYAAVADYNRAQFRLYRALGHPAQFLAGDDTACPPR